MMDASLLTLSPEPARSGCGSGAAKSKLRQKERGRGTQRARSRGAVNAHHDPDLPKGSVHARLEDCRRGAIARPSHERYKTNTMDL
jgi:hypothetical protein